jgi:hypothetical protein
MILREKEEVEIDPKSIYKYECTKCTNKYKSIDSLRKHFRVAKNHSPVKYETSRENNRSIEDIRTYHSKYNSKYYQDNVKRRRIVEKEEKALIKQEEQDKDKEKLRRLINRRFEKLREYNTQVCLLFDEAWKAKDRKK